MTAASQLIGTSTATSVDMTGGIYNRLRTMAVYRPSILLARVLSSVAQALVSMAVVFAIALPMGLSPNATPLRWLVVVGFLAHVSFALCWLGLAFGLAAKSVASASNGPSPWFCCRSSDRESSRLDRCRRACATSPNTSRSRR